jgi:hypothetical protein
MQGEMVGSFLHEKVSPATFEMFNSGHEPKGNVLFIHGGFVSSLPDFDFQHENYSRMEFLSVAGFVTFSTVLSS